MIEHTTTFKTFTVDNETVNGIQINLPHDLIWFVYYRNKMWCNSFIHTPEDNEDKLPSNMGLVESKEPIWSIRDEARNKKINRALNWCGIELNKEDLENTIMDISNHILINGFLDKIDNPLSKDDDIYDCERMVCDADINYNDPEWFLVDGKRFNIKAVSDKVIQDFKDANKSIKTIKETKEILIFHEGVYINGEYEVERFIRDLIGNHITIQRVLEVKKSIRSYTTILLEKFNPGHCINLLNGVYEIPVKTFREADEGIYNQPEMMFTYKLNVQYDVNARCPQIEDFFHWALPDDIQRQQVYEEFSYAFAPGFPIQKLFLWYGNGKNGKGVATGILRAVIGGQNISGWSVFNLENDRGYSQADMVKHKYNICGDMPSTKTPFDFVKAATGNDTIPIREIFKAPYNTINSCKILFTMNNIMKLSDFSDGALRRIIMTVWENQVDDKNIDPHLLNKLTTENEISGFFNLLVDTYDRLMERRHFIYNPTTEETEATLQELRGSDVELFIAEKCIRSPELKYERGVMYEDYKMWHENRKAIPKGRNIFNSFMRKLGYKDIRFSSARVWTGVGRPQKPNNININFGKGKK